MSTFTQILYQIVYSTKAREAVLLKENLQKLWSYKTGVLREKKCQVYQIGGVEDHVHIITQLHPSVSLSDLIKDLKLASSEFINRSGIFPEFKGWQSGYGAFTYSIDAKDNLVKYVLNQEEHHKKRTFKDELRQLLEQHKVDFDERYLL